MFAGAPVGNPSGQSQGLTPSTEQVAQAKSLAGGKVSVLPFQVRRSYFSMQENMALPTAAAFEIQRFKILSKVRR